VVNFDSQKAKTKMKILLFLLFLSIQNLNAQARLYTNSSQKVREGISFTSISAPSIPWQINVLEIDLTNPLIKIESVKASNKIYGIEKVSVMAKQNTFGNQIVVGAVNGDFYHAGGIPTNLQVRNGQIITMPIERTVIAFDINNKPMMNTVSYSGKIFSGKNSYKINGVNTSRNNNLVLYNKFFGDSTSTNSNGREVLVQRINQWLVNDTVNCVVKKIQIGIGSMLIPDTTYAVISTEGSAIEFTKHIRAGDTIKIVNSIKPAVSKIKEAIGGFVQVIKDGKDYVDQSWIKEKKPGHALLRHPRTAIGFSKDSTKLFLITVDGRQEKSVGMTLRELADLMLKLGVYQGLNLDGGGSTTMVVNNAVVNNPSGGVERAVGNGFLIIYNE